MMLVIKNYMVPANLWKINECFYGLWKTVTEILIGINEEMNFTEASWFSGSA